MKFYEVKIFLKKKFMVYEILYKCEICLEIKDYRIVKFY